MDGHVTPEDTIMVIGKRSPFKSELVLQREAMIHEAPEIWAEDSFVDEPENAILSSLDT